MKRNPRSRRTAGASEPAGALRDSAQRIWLAGLGALERARVDGPRAFESLVEQGRNMGARAVGAADEALKSMRHADFAGNHGEKLQQAFEERLTRSLTRLGVLTSKDVEDLSRQVRELSDSMRRFLSGMAGAGGAAEPAASAPRRARGTPAAAKSARRRSAKGARAKAPAAARVKKAARGTRSRKPSRGPRGTP